MVKRRLCFGAMMVLVVGLGATRPALAATALVDSELGHPASALAAIEVPGDHGSIQEAVDAAAPGDLILIAPGVYHEAVNVVTEDLTIRGLDRNGVVLDGEFELDTAIRVLADGVAIENMTAVNYATNGFFWTGVEGYRGSYLTTYRIGLYGLYAFGAVNGQFDHSYAAGVGDAGFYIGQCYPCDAVMDGVVAEHNGIGYSGTNAGGELYIINSRFNNNRVGIVPNSGTYELCYPQRDAVFAGNLVYSNNQADTPAIHDAVVMMGTGIAIAGGIGNTVANNRIWDHDRAGIALVPFLEQTPNDDQPVPDEWAQSCAEAMDEPVNPTPPDTLLWDALNNVVTGNVVEDGGVADLLVASVGTRDVSILGNCFAGNAFATASPADLEALAPCDGDGSGDWSADRIDFLQWVAEAQAAPEPPAYQDADLPDLAPQENMPDAADAPANPAREIAIDVDVAAIEVPAAPDD